MFPLSEQTLRQLDADSHRGRQELRLAGPLFLDALRNHDVSVSKEEGAALAIAFADWQVCLVSFSVNAIGRVGCSSG